MNPADCVVARRRLPSFAGGDLEPSVDATTRAHLAACPACRRELRSWLDIRGALADARREAFGGRDAAFFRSLAGDVLGAVRAESRRAPAARRRRRSRQLVAAAALFVLGVGLGLHAAWGEPGGQPSAGGRPITAPATIGATSPALWRAGADTRPVGLRTDDPSFAGLGGHARADEYLTRALSDPELDTATRGSVAPGVDRASTGER